MMLWRFFWDVDPYGVLFRRLVWTGCDEESGLEGTKDCKEHFHHCGR